MYRSLRSALHMQVVPRTSTSRSWLQIWRRSLTPTPSRFLHTLVSLYPLYMYLSAYASRMAMHFNAHIQGMQERG